MNFLRRFLTRLFNSAAGRVHEERLKEEIAEHITLQTEENLRAGLSPSRQDDKLCSSLAASKQ